MTEFLTDDEEGDPLADHYAYCSTSQTGALVFDPALQKDKGGNPFVVVIYSNGLHHLPLVYCSCKQQRPDTMEPIPEIVESLSGAA